jgi:hypothetical protein
LYIYNFKLICIPFRFTFCLFKSLQSGVFSCCCVLVLVIVLNQKVYSTFKSIRKGNSIYAFIRFWFEKKMSKIVILGQITIKFYILIIWKIIYIQLSSSYSTMNSKTFCFYFNQSYTGKDDGFKPIHKWWICFVQYLIFWFSKIIISSKQKRFSKYKISSYQLISFYFFW